MNQFPVKIMAHVILIAIEDLYVIVREQVMKMNDVRLKSMNVSVILATIMPLVSMKLMGICVLVQRVLLVNNVKIRYEND